jgi:hypothetical protein
MTLYIGVDIHARQQTLSYLDTNDGTTGQEELSHERDDIREFYRKFSGEVIIGIEACGYSNWFKRVVSERRRPDATRSNQWHGTLVRGKGAFPLKGHFLLGKKSIEINRIRKSSRLK